MNTSSTTCDIIIPTYNNAAVITHTLQALFRQTVPAKSTWQVIISDDGSTDGTVAAIKKIQPASPWPLHLLTNPHHGAAHARNQAVSISAAPLVLFLGADIILQPGALAAHADFHMHDPDSHLAALGHVTWDPVLPVSPFMSWLIHGGPQNDFDALLGQDDVDPRHYFYGSHLSLKRSMLNQETWSDKFTAYGWEDLDLGRRSAARGLILKNLFAARGLHHHLYTLDDICRRQQAAGRGLVTYQALYPTESLLPPITWRSHTKLWLVHWLGIRLALKTLLRYSGEKWTTPRLFFALTTVEYWRGVILAQQK